jgi:hypothetical protein
MAQTKTGACPFDGSHWPLQWGEQKITPLKFHLLDEGQQMDLMKYFYDQESAKNRQVLNPRIDFHSMIWATTLEKPEKT